MTDSDFVMEWNELFRIVYVAKGSAFQYMYIPEDSAHPIVQSWHAGKDMITPELTEALSSEELVRLNQFIKGYLPKPLPPDFSSMAEQLPGVKQRVRCPCGSCNKQTFPLPLRQVIIHLNDSEKWTRNQIADWLESLDIDLEFK